MNKELTINFDQLVVIPKADMRRLCEAGIIACDAKRYTRSEIAEGKAVSEGIYFVSEQRYTCLLRALSKFVAGGVR